MWYCEWFLCELRPKQLTCIWSLSYSNVQAIGPAFWVWIIQTFTFLIQVALQPSIATSVQDHSLKPCTFVAMYAHVYTTGWVRNIKLIKFMLFLLPTWVFWSLPCIKCARPKHSSSLSMPLCCDMFYCFRSKGQVFGRGAHIPSHRPLCPSPTPSRSLRFQEVLQLSHHVELRYV
jgi:hypothetical protein